MEGPVSIIIGAALSRFTYTSIRLSTSNPITDRFQCINVDGVPYSYAAPTFKAWGLLQ